MKTKSDPVKMLREIVYHIEGGYPNCINAVSSVDKDNPGLGAADRIASLTVQDEDGNRFHIQVVAL